MFTDLRLYFRNVKNLHDFPLCKWIQSYRLHNSNYIIIGWALSSKFQSSRLEKKNVFFLIRIITFNIFPIIIFRRFVQLFVHILLKKKKKCNFIINLHVSTFGTTNWNGFSVWKGKEKFFTNYSICANSMEIKLPAEMFELRAIMHRM